LGVFPSLITFLPAFKSVAFERAGRSYPASLFRRLHGQSKKFGRRLRDGRTVGAARIPVQEFALENARSGAAW